MMTLRQKIASNGPAHRPLVHEVELLERDQVAQLVLRAELPGMLAAALAEEARHARAAHRLQTLGVVDAGRAGREHRRIQVRGQQLDVEAGQHFLRFAQHHGDGIRLFAGGRRAAPDARAAHARIPGDDLRQHVAREIFEMMRLAEERGEIGRDRVGEFLELGRDAALEQLDVFAEGVRASARAGGAPGVHRRAGASRPTARCRCARAPAARMRWNCASVST